jgi:hypothetical protein
MIQVRISKIAKANGLREKKNYPQRLAGSAVALIHL